MTGIVAKMGRANRFQCWHKSEECSQVKARGCDLLAQRTISNRHQDFAASFAQKMLFDDVEIAFHCGIDTRREFFLPLRRDRSIRQSSNDHFWRRVQLIAATHSANFSAGV
jgi:hypothetical protein